MGTKSTSI